MREAAGKMAPDEILIVYDRGCPACELFATLTRVRAAAGELRLVDARDGGPVMAEITRRGLDIDHGMVVVAGGETYYGADAIHALALMSSRSGAFNRINYWAFRSKRVARVLYPVLRAMRNLLLKLRGKEKINNLGRANNEWF